MAMASAGYSRVGMRLTLLLSLSHLMSMVSGQSQASQAGFISIDCGASSDHTGTGLSFTTDDGYISTGINREVTVPLGAGYLLSTARYFTDGRSKYCYVLPVEQNTSYLIRGLFYFGDLESSIPNNYAFNVSIDANIVTELKLGASDASSPFISEVTYATGLSQSEVYYCLIPIVGSPFISSLELRPLLPTMYQGIHFKKKYTRSVATLNFGGDPSHFVRYPFDPFDRLWETPGSGFPAITNITATKAINSVLIYDQPPPVVMETAWEQDPISFPILNFPFSETPYYYLALYFADIGSPTTADYRGVDVSVNLITQEYYAITTQVKELYVPGDVKLTDSTFDISLSRTANSTLDPLLNGMEVRAVFDSVIATTNSIDVQALNDLRQDLDLLDWTGDPCIPVPWDWITCNSASSPRVTQLKLSSYGIKGTVPTSISQMTALTDLWLDNNFISGSIPDLADVSDLETLHLQNNSFTGTIPAYLANLASLSQLFLQDNSLTGPVPAALQNKPGLNLVTDDAVNDGNGSPTSNSSTKSKESSAGVIIGAIVAVVLVTLLIAGTIFCCCCMKRKKDKKNDARALLNVTPSMSPMPPGSPKMGAHSSVSVPPEPRVAGSHHAQSTRAFSKDEVVIATDNFKRKIGEGGFGPVYYGELPGGGKVAVKVNSATSNQGLTEFSTEVSLLSTVHHKNLVSLVGYCEEYNQQILIYEYMQNGTLREHLYGRGMASALDWNTRLDVALNSARGLDYLHNDCNPKIIHRDIKSNNILLNERLVAKVADFGISKLAPDEDYATGVSTMVKGTMGYLDPEYFQANKLTQKSDVYAFGVVLLEIIAGRPPFDDSLRDASQRILVEYVRRMLGAGNIDVIVDKSLRGTYNENAMWKLAELAMYCVEPLGMNRPDMRLVVKEITDTIDMENSRTPGSTQTFSSNPSTQSSMSDLYSGNYGPR